MGSSVVLRILCVILVFGFLLHPESTLAQDPPVFVTAADTFQTIHDQAFSSGAMSVLDNDTTLPIDSFVVVVTQPPANGILTLQPDGTFTYDPNPGFVGDDSFAYVVQTVPIQELTFSPASSVLTISATIDVSALGSDTDNADVPVIGTAMLDIGPNGTDILSVHVLSLELSNESSLALRFKYGSPATLLTLDVTSEAQGMQFGLNSTGAGIPVSGPFNAFTQTGNKLGVNATVNVNGSGVLGGAVPSGVQNLVTESDYDIVGSLPNPGANLVFFLTLDINNTFDLSGNAVDLAISGTAVATGPLKLGGESDPTTVTLHVISPVAVEERSETPVRARLHPVYPNPVVGEATIAFDQDRSADVRISIYDLLGREVDVLPVVSVSAGEQRIIWRPKDLPDGMYLVRVTTGTWTETRAIVVSH